MNDTISSGVSDCVGLIKLASTNTETKDLLSQITQSFLSLVCHRVTATDNDD